MKSLKDKDRAGWAAVCSASKRALLSIYINAYNGVAAPDYAVRSNLGSNHITITRVPTFTRL
ncbi:hypothetical protein GGD50_000153 [Rhizobium paranaense]|uniref:Uncharacterized protein n=1 Tax=Rhizobium paranaense TaxID=1650438 RepID=A0A7W9CYW6_9HYPH|nr:hypothetical protein [Rhizobium paranaense]